MSSLKTIAWLVAMNSLVATPANPQRYMLPLRYYLPVTASPGRPVRFSQPASYHSTIEARNKDGTFPTTCEPESVKAFSGSTGGRSGGCLPRMAARRLARLGTRHGGCVWRGRVEDTRSNHRGCVVTSRVVILGVLTNFLFGTVGGNLHVQTI